MKTRQPMLSTRRLDAIIEALAARLAGEIEADDNLAHRDYQGALEWAQAKREKRKP